jgi:hypothetical protein
LALLQAFGCSSHGRVVRRDAPVDLQRKFLAVGVRGEIAIFQEI